MTILIEIINIIINVVLLVNAPKEYSWQFCLIGLILYIISFIIYIYSKKLKNYFCFFVIFTVTFFFVFYLYPVFGINQNIKFYYSYDLNVVNKATMIATFGYNCFVLGLLFQLLIKKKKKIKSEEEKVENTNFSYFLSIMLLLIFNCLTFLKYFVFHINRYMDDSYILSSGLWGYVEILFHSSTIATLSIMYKNISKRYDNKIQLNISEKMIIFLILINILMDFINGYRGNALGWLIVIIFGWMSFKNKVTPLKIFIYMLLGLVILSFIGLKRGGGSGEFSFDIFNLTRDLMVNNYTLFAGYSIVMKTGLKPITQIASLLGMIPFGKKTFQSITGISAFEFSSADYISYIVENGNVTVGLGTNIIISCYLAFGIVGVAILMFLLGRFIESMTYNLKNKSIYKIGIALEIMDISVYWVRSEILWPFRTILYTIFFIWIIKKIKIKNRGDKI